MNVHNPFILEIHEVEISHSERCFCRSLAVLKLFNLRFVARYIVYTFNRWILLCGGRILSLVEFSSAQKSICLSGAAMADEGTSPSVTRRFQSDLYKFIELDDTRRSLKEFVPIRCPSRVMTVLLNCRPLRTHIWENRITRFWPEILLTDRRCSS